MDIKERKVVTVQEERDVFVRKVCDFCGKEITGNYFRVTTSHHDWGNDSIDSYEHMDACCPECVMKFATEYINDSYKHKINTKCIEIEHEKWV